MSCKFNFLKQVIDSQDIFLILTYHKNILTYCGILLKNYHFFVFVKYLSVHSWCEPFWEFSTKWNYMAKNLNHKKYLFMIFPKLLFAIYMCQNMITLLAIYPNLPSYKALSGSTIYEMKVWLNIDSVFKLFCLKKNTMTQCLLWPLLSYISILWDSCHANLNNCSFYPF